MPDTGTNTGINAVRPAITLAGQDNASLAEGLLSLLVVETTEGLYRSEAIVGNWGNVGNSVDFLYFDRQTLDFGKRWQIKLGSGSSAQTIFDGRIMGLQADFPQGDSARTITVLAEDRFQDLRMTRRTRTFDQVSDGDVIRKIANEHGLTPSVDVSGPTYPVLAQTNQSDLAFLRERARSVDAELWIDGTTLHAQAHDKRNGGTVDLTYGSDLHEFSVLADLAHQRSSVSVNGWNVDGKERLQYEADDAVLSGELNGDTSGAGILSQALGRRKEALVHTIPLTRQEAQATAESYFKMTARRFVVGQGVAEPNAKLRVGTYVNIKGLGPLFSGKYYLSRVQYLFDARGGRTEFTAERPGLGR